MEALTLLRDALSSGAEITYLSESASPVDDLGVATSLSLPGRDGTPVILPKHTPTALARTVLSSSPPPPDDAPGQYYDLGCLFYAALARDTPVAEYISQAVPLVQSFVSVVDRATVVAYLLGEAECPADRLYVPSERSTTPPVPPPSSLVASFSAKAEAPTVERPAKKPRYVPDEGDKAAVAKLTAFQEPDIYQLSDRNRVLRGSKARNFKPFLDSPITAMLKEAREDIKAFGAAAPVPTRTTPKQGANKRKRAANPIIVVSPSSSALITMHNVKQFLENSVFERSEDARARYGSGKQADDVVTVEHKRADSDGGPSRYLVVDGAEAVEKFGSDAWERVVCVMTTGQEWQFSSYRWPDPKELFRHVKGIYFQWTDDPPNPKLANWNVSVLRIDPSKRHIDKSSAAAFWQSLEMWISVSDGVDDRVSRGDLN